jgi:hypothetical protein
MDVANDQRRVVKLTASIEGQASDAAVVDITVQGKKSPLLAALKGPADFPATAALVLTAADSSDPDGAGRWRGLGPARAGPGRGLGRRPQGREWSRTRLI